MDKGGFLMHHGVYVWDYSPFPHDPEEAHVTVLLTDLPQEIQLTFPVESGIRAVRLDGDAREKGWVLSGTEQLIKAVSENWPPPLRDWRTALHNAFRRARNRRPHKPLQAGKWQLPWHRRTLVMGILNVTPDSFSDGGKYETIDAAVAHARALVAAGADIIDVGGESTRPAGDVYGAGADYVSAAEEKERVLPIIARLSHELDVPLSIDTYKAEVAEAAILNGACIVNDVWGLKRDPHMADVVARHDVPVVVMHNRERAAYRRPVVREIIDDLWESVVRARRAGIRDERIILDPGIGFGKTHPHNLEVMHRLERITYMGYPLLLGTSRKSLIGRTLNLPVGERLFGTAATVAWGIAKGCAIVRVHDVKEMVHVSRMTDALHFHDEEEPVHG